MECRLSFHHTLALSQIAVGKVQFQLSPDIEALTAVAKDLDLERLLELSSTMTVRPWLDGAAISGHFEARLEQVCGITLDIFEQTVGGEIDLRVVPRGSPNAPIETEDREVEWDSEVPDPPEVLDGDKIDLGAILVESLALAIDPFPRKPGAVFDYEPDTQEESPFAMLKRMTDKKA